MTPFELPLLGLIGAVPGLREGLRLEYPDATTGEITGTESAPVQLSSEGLRDPEGPPVLAQSDSIGRGEVVQYGGDRLEGWEDAVAAISSAIVSYVAWHSLPSGDRAASGHGVR